jgi:lambda family phage portal protein
VSERAHSTVRATERWNPIVGRWESTAPTSSMQPGLSAAEHTSGSISSLPASRSVPGLHPSRASIARGQRMYAAARGSRLSGGLGAGGNSSADAELSTSLPQLRARSRQMVRDSAYAKRAKVLVQNNVVGMGVGLQAQVANTRGGLRTDINASIEEAWRDWCAADCCHTGGKLHFSDQERAFMGQVFEAGEVFVRLHFSAFGASEVPLALELVEAERLPAEIAVPGAQRTDTEMRQGIEVDRFGRPVAYWIRERHGSDIRLRGNSVDRYERVPADQVMHLHLVERWPQTRGEPWLHAIARKLDDMNEVSGSEVAAARASSYYFATIETPDQAPLVNDEEGELEQGVMSIEPLTVQELKPGEKLTFHAPNRPNAQLDPFMRLMLREVAAGCGVSYESLSRDYSQSNYSSSRLALLDDRDLYKVLQQWWIRSFRLPLHKLWLRQAVLAGAIPAISVEQYALQRKKFEAVLFKPRGWAWVDPTKEVRAYKEAVAAGLTTLTDVIAQTADGRDIEDVIATRRRELDMLADAGIDVDTTVQPPAPPEDPDGEGDDGNATPAQPARVLSLAKKGQA